MPGNGRDARGTEIAAGVLECGREAAAFHMNLI